MSKQEVRVGQVWRCEGGAELAVTRVCAGIAHFERRDSSTAAHVAAYMTPYTGWTLVQDAPETVDWTAGGRWKPEADCCEMLTAEDVCCGACPDCQPIKNALPEDRVPFQKDACSALLEQLPVSERFVVSRRDTHLAGVKAIADLRRKVMGHKAWPVCPVSKQDLRIKATVSEEHKSKGCFRPTETVRTWQAAFTCSHCTGGGR